MIGAIHSFSIRTKGASVTDAEGRTTRPTTDEVYRGSVDELSARDVEIAAQNGQTHDLAIRAPLEAVVTDQSQAVVTEPARLAGTYEIDVIRTLRTHLRLLCSKTTVRQ